MEEEHLCNPWDLDSSGDGIQTVWCKVCGRTWAPSPSMKTSLLCHACHKRKPVDHQVMCAGCLDKWIEDTEDEMKVSRVYGGYVLDPKPSFVEAKAKQKEAIAAARGRGRQRR